jgi:hypothetical protein
MIYLAGGKWFMRAYSLKIYWPINFNIITAGRASEHECANFYISSVRKSVNLADWSAYFFDCRLSQFAEMEAGPQHNWTESVHTHTLCVCKTCWLWHSLHAIHKSEAITKILYTHLFFLENRFHCSEMV